ncbi:MAG: FAD-dependent oxidoreductase [Pseudomonadota bacterium]
MTNDRVCEVAVVGAGVVGISSALYLQRDGRRVAVFDPDPPGEGCSAGNAGGIVTSAVVPVATPGILAALPRMLADPLSPLAIRWRYLPRLMPWLWQFVRASAPQRVGGL